MTAGPGSDAGRPPRTTPVDQIVRFFRSRGKRVVSFAGFGELGYEDEGGVERIMRGVLGEWEPARVLVSCGTLLREGGQDGVARVFAVARDMGIETAGIHPGAALGFLDTHRPSPHETFTFYVDDPTWGGFLGDRREPSRTLRTMLEVTDELVVIGGGKHAADELDAFLEAGRRVRYFEAEMNHRSTIEWCREAGVEIEDFRGAARAVWRSWFEGRTTSASGVDEGRLRFQD